MATKRINLSFSMIERMMLRYITYSTQRYKTDYNKGSIKLYEKGIRILIRNSKTGYKGSPV